MADTTAIAIYKMGLDTQDYVRGAAAAKQSTDAVVASAEKLATTEEKVTRATRTSGDELSKLAARYDQRIKLEQRLANEQARMARLEREGVGSPEERARVYSLVETSIRRQIDDLNKQEAAMRKSSTATGLARHEMINLSRQIQDVGVSLAGGQSPFRILVEQGSQIADIFASSRATVGDFFRSIGAGIGRLGAGAAFAGIAAGIVAIGAGAITAALNWGSARNEIEKALLGIGRASGATVDSIEKIATTSASTFGLSISEAREFAGILAATGRIGIEQIGGLTQLGKNLAITLGVDSTEAAKTLAKALAEPGKGVESLNEKLGAFSAGTVRVVQNLVAQNKIMEAQKVIAEGVAEATKNAGDAASTSIQFWTALGNTLSDVWTTIGKIAARTTGIGLKVGVDEAVEEAQKALEAARQQQDIGGMPGVGIGPDPERIRQAEEALRKATEAQARWRAEAEATAANIRSLADAKLIRDLSPEIAQMEEVRNRAEGLALILERTRAAMAQGEFMPGAAPEIARAGASMEQLALSAARAKEAAESMLSPAQRLTAEFQLSMAAITARTSAERQSVAAFQTELQLAGQNVSLEEKRLAIERAISLEITRQAAAHKDNVAALTDQLNVSKARPGAAQQAAQYEADINSRLREGATLMQAETEAALKRATTIAQANRAIEQQIISMREALEMERARLDGTEGATAAAQAYARAIRAGADSTHAAALAAATLEDHMERAQIAAERMANEVGRASSMGGGLGEKLARIGMGGRSFDLGTVPLDQIKTSLGSGSIVGITVPMQGSYDRAAELAGVAKVKAAMEAAARAGEEAARAQEEAARASQAAAEAQIAAAEALQKAQKEWFDERVAQMLISGATPQAINQLIESGQLRFGSPEDIFKTQIDLYKRAGMTNAQILADIRSGVIGEGARPTELLSAIDSLTGAVENNTAAQLGLSEFYTQQGDRLLGYRGFNVQRARIPFEGGGTGGAGTGALPGGMPGGVINPVPPYVVPPLPPTSVGGPAGPSGSGGVALMQRILNGKIVEGYYTPAGEWVTTRVITVAPGVTTPANTPGVVVGSPPQYRPGVSLPIGGSSSPGLPIGGSPPRSISFAEGGIADRRTFAMFGERGPEAFVPLKGGAIPVRLMGNAANQNVVNINAPLVHFATEPTRDEVRQSAFQAAQMLRRVAMG